MKDKITDIAIEIIYWIAGITFVILLIGLSYKICDLIYEDIKGTNEVCLGGHYTYRNVKIGNTYQLQKFFQCDSAKIIY
jgi:hypothetical protein